MHTAHTDPQAASTLSPNTPNITRALVHNLTFTQHVYCTSPTLRKHRKPSQRLHPEHHAGPAGYAVLLRFAHSRALLPTACPFPPRNRQHVVLSCMQRCLWALVVSCSTYQRIWPPNALYVFNACTTPYTYSCLAVNPTRSGGECATCAVCCTCGRLPATMLLHSFSNRRCDIILMPMRRTPIKQNP
jgi:hypothetical protein